MLVTYEERERETLVLLAFYKKIHKESGNSEGSVLKQNPVLEGKPRADVETVGQIENDIH